MKTLKLTSVIGNYPMLFFIVNFSEDFNTVKIVKHGNTFTEIDRLVFKGEPSYYAQRKLKFNELDDSRSQIILNEQFSGSDINPIGINWHRVTINAFRCSFFGGDQKKGGFCWYDPITKRYGNGVIELIENNQQIYTSQLPLTGDYNSISYNPGGSYPGVPDGKYFIFEDLTQTGIFDNLIPVNVFPGDSSGSGGGTGTLDDTQDNIDYPDLPSLSATSAGFISLYVPTQSQMHDLSSFMWSDSFNLDQFKKIFADPMDVIIGLNIIPTQVPSAGSETIKIGLIDTGVSMNKASEQYISVNCGSIDIKEYWGSALDYSPYTKMSIFLPYIGTRELKTDDVMGKTISVKYNIDILSGACTALIKCADSVLYEFSGSCGSPIPLTSVNWTNTVTAGIQLAAAGIGVAAGAAGAAAGAAGASAGGLTAVQGANLVSSTAGSVMSAKPNIQRSGAVSGSAGMLGLQIPYLIVERPRQSLADGYNKYVGYPSNITAKLSDLNGYTEVESIHLDGFNATDAEIKEMYSLLREGVIL